MAFKIMADNGVPISAAQDGALYDALGQQQSYVIDGIANNMAIGYNASSLNVTLASGECVIRGRHITNTASVTLTLPANSSRYIVLRYASSDDSVSFMATTTTTNGNINNGNVTADLVLAYVTTNATGVSSYTDRTLLSTNLFTTPRKVFVRQGRNTPSEPANATNVNALCICAGSDYIQFWLCVAGSPSSYYWFCLGRVDGTNSYGNHYPS